MIYLSCISLYLTPPIVNKHSHNLFVTQKSKHKVCISTNSKTSNWEWYPYRECTSESFWNKIDHFSVQWWILNRKWAIFASKMNIFTSKVRNLLIETVIFRPEISILDWNLVQGIIFVCFQIFLICFFKILFEKYTFVIADW